MEMELALFISGVVLGFVANLITNEISTRRQTKATAAQLAKQYAGITGDYIAFPLDNHDINFNDSIGECRIDYQGGHILRLRYKEKNHDHIWEAEIWMTTQFTGSLVYRYVRLFGQESPLACNFGFKRFAIFDRPGRDGSIRKFFCLQGEAPYGKEAMERQ